MTENENETQNLSERLAFLEGRLQADENSPSEKISLWGGLLALLISILIGGFQIYEYTVLRQQEAREENIRQLGAYVRRISELNSDLASKFILATTGQEKARAAAEGKIINAEKFSLVGLAGRLLEEQPDIGGFAVYITLTNELSSQGDSLTALRYAESALTASKTKLEEVESLRYIAQVLFTPGEAQDLNLARKKFKEAKDLAKSEKSFMRGQLLANILSSRIVAEAVFGDCQNAKEAFNALQSELSGANFSRVLQATIGEVQFGIQGQTPCTNLYQP